nr:hypothetical protein [Tanacetum cinerariifolium]
SITTWEDLTTRFLAQLFPPRRTAKLHNDILMFQQHHGESLSEAWTRRTVDQSVGGKLRDRNAEEFWGLLKDLALYDNESWNDPRDFAKPTKAIALPQDVLSTSNRRLIELKNQYYMENPKQAFVEYASSATDKVGGKRFTPNQRPSNFNDATNTWKEKPNFNWARSQTFTNLKNRSISVHSSSYQMRLEKALLDFNSNHEKRHGLGKMTRGNEEVKEQGKEDDEMETNMKVKEVIEEEESEFETDEEVKEILEEEEEDEDDENFNLFLTMKELSHHEWLLKNP